MFFLCLLVNKIYNILDKSRPMMSLIAPRGEKKNLITVFATVNNQLKTLDAIWPKDPRDRKKGWIVDEKIDPACIVSGAKGARRAKREVDSATVGKLKM